MKTKRRMKYNCPRRVLAQQGFGPEAKTRGGINRTEENKSRNRHNVE